MATNQNLWPSQAVSTTRASKSAPFKSTVPTDWASGWIVMLLIFGMVAGVASLVWPFAMQALDSLTSITDALNLATRRGA